MQGCEYAAYFEFWALLTCDRFMAASKVLGEESIQQQQGGKT
jgi:hypothetical protein